MVVAKLLTLKDFSPHSLINTMRAAWNLARDGSFRPIGKSMFVVQAYCLGDWKRIMEEGPWTFRGYALMLEPFDGSTTTPKIVLDKVPAWIQIHRIPHLYRTESIIKLLAQKVGEDVKVDMRVVPSSMGDFHRVRVMLRASAPLARFMTLSPEGRDAIILQIKYEKMPRFCSYCSFMVHVHLECGTGEHDEKDLQYGEWMLAEEETWRAGTPRFCAQMPAGRDIPRGDFGRGTRGGRAPHKPSRSRAWTYDGGRVPVWREKEHQDGEKSLSRKRNSAEAGVDAEKDEALKDKLPAL